MFKLFQHLCDATCKMKIKALFCEVMARDAFNGIHEIHCCFVIIFPLQ